jgi:hypothetical protein
VVALSLAPFLFASPAIRGRRNLSRAFPELSETEIASLFAGMWDISAASRPNTRISGKSASNRVLALKRTRFSIGLAGA